MRNEPVKQHIVPRAYLKRFANGEGKRFVIGTELLDPDNHRFFEQSIENVGYEKNIYDSADETDPKKWEKFLADSIDTLCGTQLSSIISIINLSTNKATVLREKEKEILSKLIVAQLMRLPKSINRVREANQRVAQKTGESILSFFPDEVRSILQPKIKNAMEIVQTRYKDLFFESALASDNFAKYCGILKQGVWSVLCNVNSGILPFITSDNPVVLESVNRQRSGLFNVGLAEQNAYILYPITPGIMIAWYSQNGMFSLISEETDGKKIDLNDNPFVIRANLKIREQAKKHVFYPQPLFDEIRKQT